MLNLIDKTGERARIWAHLVVREKGQRECFASFTALEAKRRLVEETASRSPKTKFDTFFFETVCLG
jgi:hypothetical protein